VFTTRDRVFGALAVAAAAATWGSVGLLAKILYAEDVSFEALSAFRAVFGWLAVAGFLVWRRGLGGLKAPRRDFLHLVPMGAFGIGAFYLFYYYTLRESEVGTAAILLYSFPAFVVILARIFLGERLTGARTLAVLLTIVGICLVVGVYDLSSLAISPKVLATGLLAGLTFGLYPLFGRPISGRLDPAVILFYTLAFAAILLSVAAVPTLSTLGGLPVGYYGLLLMMALVHTALTYALYTFGIRRLEAGQVAVTATVEPVVAGLLGVALLGEQATAVKLAGGLLVVLGAALAQLRPRSSLPRSAGATARQR
jgi:drug/metabolite transporter (DMT)-like permease